jgi:hypothetical protein
VKELRSKARIKPQSIETFLLNKPYGSERERHPMYDGGYTEMADKVFKGKISAKGTEITVLSKGTDDDYISLTDIAKYKNADFSSDVIQNWMRLRGTVEYLGLWERLHNPNFNYLEFEVIEREAGKNSFVLTPKKWIETTRAVGMTSKQGRYIKITRETLQPNDRLLQVLYV